MDEKAHTQRVDASELVLDLNFVPQWARKPPEHNHYAAAPEPRHERRDVRRDDRPRRPRPPASVERRPRAEPEAVRAVPVHISFLPEQKRLGLLARQVRHSNRAYPLIGLANLLIHDNEGYMVKVEVHAEARDFSLYQCRCCKAVATSAERMEQHIFAKHLADFFDQEEIETDPPAGQYVCVARCRRSGVLLAPPNHHSYNDCLAALHQAHFPQLSLDEVKRNIETVHDEALIEQWRQQSRRKTVYRPRNAPDAEPMTAVQAEADFRRRLPELYEPVRRAVMPSAVAQELTDRDLTHAIGRVWAKESQFPLSMSFAMRTAFRHMHLHLFKAGKVNFVTHIKPHFVPPEKTVDNIAEVLAFLKEHPGSSREDLLLALHPTIDPASPEALAALQPLGWLIERGHIIEFYNGTLSIPLGRRA